MNNELFQRLEMLIGTDNLHKLYQAKVLVLGLGGVGGYAVEALARSGIGTLGIVDRDTVDITNTNRQLIAFPNTVGAYKTTLWKDRILKINPDCQVIEYPFFYLPDSDNTIDFEHYDFIVEAIDTIKAKIGVISVAQEKHIPIISSLGTGGRLHPELFRIGDMFETKEDPLARQMRKEMRHHALSSIPCVYSLEIPKKSDVKNPENGKTVNGTSAFCPAVAGELMASYVVNHIIGPLDFKPADN